MLSPKFEHFAPALGVAAIAGVANKPRIKSGARTRARSFFISEVWGGNFWFTRRFDLKSVGILSSFR
jgi:hypothetical protein